MKYSVYWTNMGYSSQEQFDTAEAAIKYAKSKGFEATILDSNNDVIASWGYIAGTRWF